MKRRSEVDYLNTLMKDLDRGNNLIDFFLVIGLNEKTIFDDFLYENDLNTLNARIKPDIVSKFPPFDKKIIAIDDNIINHCFPNGYKIRESNGFLKPESFCFVLDNSLFSLKFPQKYISCLIFYEKLENYSRIHNTYKNFEFEGKEEGNSHKNTSESINDELKRQTNLSDDTKISTLGCDGRSTITINNSFLQTDTKNLDISKTKSMEEKDKMFSLKIKIGKVVI